MKKKGPIIAIAAIIIAVFALVFLLKSMNRNHIDTMMANNQMINVLVAGSNEFNAHHHKFYGILSINPENNRIGFMFIPPDFRLDMNGKGKYLRLGDADFRDFEDISTALSRNLKFKPTFYVELYGPDVERLTDLFGGINLYLLTQKDYITTEKYGLNYLDGGKTMRYINSVAADSIFLKFDRIQDIISTIFDHRNNYNDQLNDKLVDEALSGINTNLLSKEVMSLLKAFNKGADLQCMVVPGRMENGNSYVMDDIAQSFFEKEFIRKLVDVEQKNPDLPSITLLNGTGESGIAKRVRANMIKEGYKVVEFGTSDYPVQEKTLVINQKGNSALTRQVATYLGIGEIYNISNSTEFSSVLVILGKDYNQ